MLLDSLAVFAAAALIFIPLERMLPLHRGQGWLRHGTLTDVLHFFVGGFLVRAGAVATMLFLSAAALSVVPEAWRDAIRAQPDWLEFVELLLLADLGLYLAHRLAHAWPWLWRFHSVHHSSEQLDWLAAYRVHPVDQVFTSSVVALPGLMLGFSPGPLLVYALCYRWHALLLHSNVRIELGPLGRWIATPRFHHWHHADERQAYDRNFGGQLVVWDRLFGTCHEETRLPHRYGVSGEVADDYVGQLVRPFGLRFPRFRADDPAGDPTGIGLVRAGAGTGSSEFAGRYAAPPPTNDE